MVRRYEQHCALTHALDIVGNRWALPIVRELMAGPRRFTDLTEGLVAVPTNLLSERLKEMEGAGLVERRRLDPPASSVTVYELTGEGRALIKPVLELTRFGMRTLPPQREGRPFRSRWLILAMNARFDSVTARGVTESYEFRIEGDETVHFDVADGRGTAQVGPADSPAVVISADADTFLELTSGEIDAAMAVARGASIEGTPASIERMRSILPSRGAQAEALAA